jgi:hypothetical protein
MAVLDLNKSITGPPAMKHPLAAAAKGWFKCQKLKETDNGRACDLSQRLAAN